MKREIFSFFILCFYGCGNILTSNSQFIKFNEMVKEWDTITINSLKRCALQNAELSGKLNLIRTSLENKIHKVDFLDRERFEFALANDSTNIKIPKNYEMLIIELNISGEQNLFSKFLINIDSQFCYYFFKETDGAWVLKKRFKIDKEQLLFINNISSEIILNKSNIYWGKRMNDILIISKFQENSIKVKPVLLLTKDIFDKLRNILMGNVSN